MRRPFKPTVALSGAYFFFIVLFLPFFRRLFLRILMLQVRFQLTLAIRPP